MQLASVSQGESGEQQEMVVVKEDEVPGQLYMCGPGLFGRYSGHSEAVADDQGWFRTGDIAYVKRDEYFIVGRTKELIKVRG